MCLIILKHPNFNISNYKNDIALFKLETRAIFSFTVRPICLSNDFIAEAGKRAIVIGWVYIFLLL